MAAAAAARQTVFGAIRNPSRERRQSACDFPRRAISAMRNAQLGGPVEMTTFLSSTRSMSYIRQHTLYGTQVIFEEKQGTETSLTQKSKGQMSLI